MRARLHFLMLNFGHFLDHLFMLVFATVAALALSREWGLSYADLVLYATPGFIAFGIFSLPAGWLADHWTRHGMLAVFFIGCGLASIATAFATSPLQVGLGLFVIGVFAAIYHPVGLALVVERREKTGMAIAINGVWGNMGVGSAALITGYFIDHGGWRTAFVVPGVISALVGVAYVTLMWREIWQTPQRSRMSMAQQSSAILGRDMVLRLSLIIFFTAAVSSIIFQSTTFALPKVFDERLKGLAGSATLIGWLGFLVFAIASMAQLVVGKLLDRIGPRTVFLTAAAVQVLFFSLMPGLSDWPAFLVAIAFMLAVFGQIPINDYMIGRLAKSEMRASVYGARYLVSFVALAATLPLISWIHRGWGFDMLFLVLAFTAACIFAVVWLLPREMPTPQAEVVAARA